MFRWSFHLIGALALAASMSAIAKPIAYANGTTVMAEYGGGTMTEVQIFYAPRYDYSVGGGHLELASDESTKLRLINYARLNYLAHRWNLEDAQGNVFVWGGLGRATGNSFSGAVLAENAGAQGDYETRRLYASLKVDWHGSTAFSHRIDTLQLGVAPYKHDYGGLATWFLIQARHYTGDIHRGTESALLLRLFRGGAWVEAGVTNDGKLQAMAMFNF
ncbi:MAG TPA: hypothetical protein VK130_07750 [Steroidobacteraceae bacterium]|nr:hypothetical protein [Steroidobacteraceae bacterium]